MSAVQTATADPLLPPGGVATNPLKTTTGTQIYDDVGLAAMKASPSLVPYYWRQPQQIVNRAARYPTVTTIPGGYIKLLPVQIGWGLAAQNAAQANATGAAWNASQVSATTAFVAAAAAFTAGAAVLSASAAASPAASVAGTSAGAPAAVPASAGTSVAALPTPSLSTIASAAPSSGVSIGGGLSVGGGVSVPTNPLLAGITTPSISTAPFAGAASQAAISSGAPGLLQQAAALVDTGTASLGTALTAIGGVGGVAKTLVATPKPTAPVPQQAPAPQSGLGAWLLPLAVIGVVVYAVHS